MNHLTIVPIPMLIAVFLAFRTSVTHETTDAPTAILPMGATSESLWLKEADKRLKRWHGYHAEHVKDFSFEDFILEDTFHDVGFIEIEAIPTDPALEKYRFPSPSSGKQLDIYCYERKLIADKDGKPELAAQSLDSEVAIYGKTADKKLRLLFCGSSCEFEDAAWIDDDRLLVAGTSSEVDGKNHPMVWGIKLSTQSVFRYVHPAEVPSSLKSFFNNVIALR